MSNVFSFVDTWNAGGTTFDGIKLNISNGASGAPVGSALSRALRFQNNAADIYSLGVDGYHHFKPTGDNIFQFDPGGIDANAGSFYFNQNAADINGPASARKDVVWTFGYNVNSGGGRVNNAEPTLALHFESYYHQDGTGVESTLEWHLQSVDTGGSAHRILTFQVPRDGASTTTRPGGAIAVDYLSLCDYAGTQWVKYDFNSVAGVTQITYNQESVHQYGVNNKAITKQINAAAGSFLSLPYVDNTDRLAVTQPIVLSPPQPSSTQEDAYFRLKAQTTAASGKYLWRADFANAVTGSVYAGYFAGQCTVELTHELANYGTGDACDYIHSWTGDAKTKWGRNGGGTWSMGLDGSDSDALVLSAGAALGTTNRIRIDANVVGFPTLPPKITPVAVASLPSAATVGAGTRHHVTDALTPTFGATVANGGAVSTPVYSDGTNWKVG